MTTQNKILAAGIFVFLLFWAGMTGDREAYFWFALFAVLLLGVVIGQKQAD